MPVSRMITLVPIFATLALLGWAQGRAPVARAETTQNSSVPPPIFLESRVRLNTLYLDGRQRALQSVEIGVDPEHRVGLDTLFLRAQFAGHAVYTLYAPKAFFKTGGNVAYGAEGLSREAFDRIVAEQALPLLVVDGQNYSAVFNASHRHGAYLGLRVPPGPGAVVVGPADELSIAARLALADASKVVRVRFSLLLTDDLRKKLGELTAG